MWKLVEIFQQTYFIYCNFNTNKQDVTFILYDLKDTWSQTLSFSDVKLKVKLLNKRFDFSEDNIKEALTRDVLQSAAIEEKPHTSTINVESCLLKLKYRVKNCLLNYEWTLRKQSQIEFQQTFVQPLLVALFGCHQQVEILTESLRKKDLELKQYRIEGAVLNRKTLVTKPFDFDDFTKKFEDCNKIAINFKELAKYIKENNSKDVLHMLNKNLNVDKSEQEIKNEEKQNEAQNDNTKLSPRQKKRKAKEIKLQHLEHHLKLRKQGIEYESSQSQTQSSGNSQSMEETEANDVKQQKQNSTKVTESKSKKTFTPRKSDRCSPVKQKREYISSEDKTDSDNDELSRTLRERKSTRKNNSINSNEEDATKRPENNKKNNAKDTTRKRVKSLSLSYNCQTQSPQNSLENSDIFDFLTDTDDNMHAIERTKSLKTKYHKLSSRDSGKCLRNISPVDETIAVESVEVPISSLSPKSKKLSDSPTPVVIDDLSSQLNNIKKELECLEAMRLADLKQRMCKA